MLRRIHLLFCLFSFPWFMHILTFISITTLSLISTVIVNGASVPREVQVSDVYAPPILWPDANTIWHSGENTTVFWDNLNPPDSISSNTTSITLNLPIPPKDYSQVPVLARNFNIRKGYVEVIVPDVPTGLYSITLFGDSGNISEKFLIKSNKTASMSSYMPTSTQPSTPSNSLSTLSSTLSSTPRVSAKPVLY